MKAIETKKPEFLCLNDLVKGIREDSNKQEPLIRELELAAMLKLLDQLSATGIVRIPAIVHGAVMAERDRVAILADSASIG